jgi:hypothetical protein
MLKFHKKHLWLCYWMIKYYLQDIENPDDVKIIRFFILGI